MNTRTILTLCSALVFGGAILSGAGIFGIVPPEGDPFEIQVEAGDLLIVPAMTRHWFTLTETKQVVALRIFTTAAGWTAIYERPLLESAQ